jgi:hypothetical protein
MDRDRYDVAMRCAGTGDHNARPIIGNPVRVLTIDSSSRDVACTLQDKAPTNVLAPTLALTA